MSKNNTPYDSDEDDDHIDDSHTIIIFDLVVKAHKGYTPCDFKYFSTTLHQVVVAITNSASKQSLSTLVLHGNHKDRFAPTRDGIKFSSDKHDILVNIGFKIGPSFVIRPSERCPRLAHGHNNIVSGERV